jgi:cytochrome c-type biogenesis protein CcmH/NrfG
VGILEFNTQQFPESSAAWTSLGHALSAYGDHSGARAGFRRALQLDPGNAEARQGLDGL